MQMLSADRKMCLEDYAYVSMDLSRSELPILWPNSRDEPGECEGLSVPDVANGGVTHLSSELPHSQPDRQNFQQSWQFCAQRCCAPACCHSGHIWQWACLQVPV